MSSFIPVNPHPSDAGDAIAAPQTPAPRLFPVAGLFLGAPLVAEFLLGNMSVTHLGLLSILAPLYGGGALLIRESVRRARRGWPSIFILALAYGFLEEAFLLQSLFNPNFLGKNLHLLAHAYLPVFGIGGWYTLFVLTLHTVWSISVPISLVESLVPEHADSPWLGRLGLAIIALVFALACFAIALSTMRRDPFHFVSSRMQFTWSAIIILALIAAAFCLPQRSALAMTRPLPNPWALAIGSFVVASAFLAIPRGWGWWALLAYVAFDVLTILLVWNWSHRAGWQAIQELGLAGGAAMAYATHAFMETPSLGNAGTITRIGNLVFALLAATLLAVGARQLRYQESKKTSRRNAADSRTPRE